MPKEVTDLSIRKKMRKGTHSCFECRRRKIRCIFPPDNPNVCSECFARGSRCIDQENANPDVIVDHRKNLRERVSRLEALVDSLLEDKTERSATETQTSSSKTPNVIPRDTFPPTPLSSETSSSVLQGLQHAPSERGHHVPILSVLEDALNDAEVRIKERMEPQRKDSAPSPSLAATERYTVTCKNTDDMDENNSAAFQAKRERAKKGLLAVLPPYDQLTRILNTNSEWWETWRRKCSGTSGEHTLPQFAAKALAEGNIGAIATVVLSVGICSDENDVGRYIEAVDQYMLADDEYAATLEGMECLILKAKWYADVGQPRRAWLAYRKGLMYTQLMGLHRKRTTSAAHESIWWSLYHGDRFLSLLLGLPYGISDTHCDLTLPEMGGEFMAPLIFMNKVSILAGKVIDRNQGVAEQSFAWALQLDQELEDLWKKLDPNWIEFSSLMADIEGNAADLRERLMAQMVYHQIRVYLHLPFMLKSQSNSRFAYSRTACLNGSREVLRLYQCLRTGEVQPLYECKAVDFIGFTSAVLIMLGLFNFGVVMGGVSPKDQETDVRLIEISIDIFRRASSEKGGKVALQSAEVLEKMLRKFKADWGRAEGGCDDFTDFVIPYFGTISIRRGGKPAIPGPKYKKVGTINPNPSTTSPSQFTPSSENTGSDLFGANLTATTTTSTSQDAFNLNTDPFVSYDGFYNLGTNNTADSANGSSLGTQINDDSMNNFPLPTNNFSWQNMPMDIDQDWSWFLNDNQTALPTQLVGDQFTQSAFTGFG
ncbi:uncharacterized protein BDR25DRAFT_331997 [Lindgomyces ingoldianus]|uniref:Uncharacterized protein n=1 Tax=Lindgomyces ingoldianus TaxID=673940 RepID=A0ACB6R5I8_9PLEO|nr:uncharacterized protein BDR25DRAFT_331997 [Lindgomyces ingoldianus]KAF2474574.1 hypothetical protein BDR25DRAFT_331997 [Lindgomyces ingoldianus]